MLWIWYLLGQDWFILLAAISALALGMFPVIHHLGFGLRERRREILSYFQPPSILLYFKKFYSAEWEELNRHKASANYNQLVVKQFEQMYDQRFGKRTFVLPFVVYFIALATLIGLTAFAMRSGNPKWNGATLDVKGVYALAGAYLWVILDLISRYRQRDLVPSALYGYAFRFMMAVPVAHALSSLFSEFAAPPLAFALGAFPTSTLMLVLRRQAGPRLGLGDDTQSPKSELEDLQGFNTTIAEKFSELGIMTTLQLAYEDPIQLTMRTNLAFNFITDAVSQALATVYGLNLKVTRPYSVRGAFEASEIYDDFVQDKDKEAKARADAVIAELAVKLEKPQRIVQKILYDIQEDPYSKFLREIWSE